MNDMTTYEHTLKLRLSSNNKPDNKDNKVKQLESTNICSVFKINTTKINKSPLKEVTSPREDTYRLNSINELKNKSNMFTASSVLQEKNLNTISTGLPCINYNSNSNNNNRYLKVDYENNDLTSNDASKLSSYRSENQDSLVGKLPPLMPIQSNRPKIVKLPINFDDDDNNTNTNTNTNNNSNKKSIDNDSYSLRGKSNSRSNSSRSETRKKN